MVCVDDAMVDPMKGFFLILFIGGDTHGRDGGDESI